MADSIPVVRLWKGWFTPQSTDPVVAFRERALRILLPAFTLIRAATIYYQHQAGILGKTSLFPPVVVILFYAIPMVIAHLALSRQRVDLAAYAFLAFWYLTDLTSLPREGYWYANFQISLIMQVILSGLILPRQGMVFFVLFQLVTVIPFGAWLDANWYDPPLLSNGEPLTSFLTTAITLAIQEAIVLVIVRYLRSQLEKYLELQQGTISRLEQEVTDRLQAESAVRESESKYRNLVENAPLGIISCDLQGQITNVNRTLLEILGSSSAAETSKINVLTFPPLVEAGIANQVRCCIEQGEDSVSEHLYDTKWGRSVHMRLYLTPTRDASGAIAGAQGMIEDITERVQADQALRESEERLQMSLQGADLGLWDLDMRSNAIVVNPHWAEMLGYRLEELEPHIDTWQEMTHPDDLPQVQAAVNAHVQHRTPFYRIEYRIRSKSGEWEWVSARAKVVEWSKDGQPLRMAGTHLLITESKQAEQELRQYRDHLEDLVRDRTTELRRVVNLMAGREVRMAELKETVRQLRAQLRENGIVPVEQEGVDVQEHRT